MSFKKQLFLLLFIVIGAKIGAQEVTVSKEFNLKSDKAYEVLGKIGDNILLFRDGGSKYSFEIMSQDLTYKLTKEIRLEKKKVDVIGLIPLDTSFVFYYSFKEDGFTNIVSRRFDEDINPIDTVLLYNEQLKVFKSNFDISFSKDKSKALIYSNVNRDKINLITVNVKDNKLIYDDIIVYDDFDLTREFGKAIIGNDAEVFLLFHKNNQRNKRENHLIEVNFVSPKTDDIQSLRILFKKHLTADLDLFYDNRRKSLMLAGLYHEKSKTASQGYFFVRNNIYAFNEYSEPIIIPYNEDVLQDIYAKEWNKKAELHHFKIKDCLFREDGGFVLLTEMNKELSRRTYYNGFSRLSNQTQTNGGVWIDYYNENIVLFAVKPSGIEHWTKVLHKKQFSQDDGDIYGSFFAFKTPSRLRFLYNDEIKKNNTVSEYVIDPLGEFERNAVLSTDYQNLRLRFRDALQISSDELLIPSQRTYNLNLVKIRY